MNNILLVPHPMLRQKAITLKKITLKEIDISKKMIDIMLKAPGVGLAANQIGILKQIVTINLINEEKKTDNIYTLFNPKIISYSKETVIMEEGCLSLPEQYADVERPKDIVVEYIDENKKTVKSAVEGYEARILQHEIDHLSGKLFVDYLSSLKRNMLIKKVKKMKNVKNK